MVRSSIVLAFKPHHTLLKLVWVYYHLISHCTALYFFSVEGQWAIFGPIFGRPVRQAADQNEREGREAERKPTFLTVVIGRAGGARGRHLVGGWVHDQFAHVLLRLEDDDVHLGHEQTQQRHRGAERDGHAQRRDLDLRTQNEHTTVSIQWTGAERWQGITWTRSGRYDNSQRTRHTQRRNVDLWTHNEGLMK